MHVAERGSNDPGSKGRCIQFVIGVQDESDIERALRCGDWEISPFNWYRKFAACDRVRSGSTNWPALANAIVGGNCVSDL